MFISKVSSDLFSQEKSINDINEKNNNGLTPLMQAVKKEDLKEVKKLLEMGADPDIQDSNGNTALSLAIIKGYNDIVELLLEKNANVNTQNTAGHSPLIRAVMANNKNIVALLLSRKDIKVDYSDKNGTTALQWGIEKGIDMIEMLLNAGADINWLNNGGLTPLMYAILSENHSEEYILNIVQYLLKRGANINTQATNKKCAALIFASKHGYKDVVRVLCNEKNTDVNIQNNIGKTALMSAVTLTPHNEEIVKILLDNGADPNIKDITGKTSLTHALPHNEKVVKILLDNGADPNIKDAKGKTSLTHAVILHNEEIVKILLDNGADPNIKDITGETPLSYAYKHNLIKDITGDLYHMHINTT